MTKSQPPGSNIGNVTLVPSSTLTIGRGDNQDINLSSKAVSHEAAVVTVDAHERVHLQDVASSKNNYIYHQGAVTSPLGSTVQVACVSDIIYLGPIEKRSDNVIECAFSFDSID